MAIKGIGANWRGRMVFPAATLFVLIILWSIVVGLVRYIYEAHIGFSLWDAGYLWYGVQRVLHGEVPVRDFEAYDPGRYYWAAFCLWLCKANGIVAVRAATLAFSVFGLISAGWLVMQGASGSKAFRFMLSMLAVVVAAMWMVPWWKAYDAAISLILVVSLSLVLNNPVPQRFFLHGVVGGIAAVFGRNHGVYALLGCLIAVPALLLCAHRPKWRRCIPAWSLGVLLGFSPILLLMAFAPGFAGEFKHGIYYMLFELKSTNISLPIPWPWSVHFTWANWQASLRSWVIGVCFVSLPLFCLVGIVVYAKRCIVTRGLPITAPVSVACVVMALPYLNVAFSRAEVGHLAQAILPAVMGVFVFPISGFARLVTHRIALVLLTCMTVYVTFPLHPGFVMRTESDWTPVKVQDDIVWMDPATAAQVKDIKALAATRFSKGCTLLAAPVWPGVYALLYVRSPVWEIYPLTRRADAFQRGEITRLRAVRTCLVLVDDIALDGREDLRYPNTHPLLWGYIVEHYREVASPPGEPQLRVFVPKE